MGEKLLHLRVPAPDDQEEERPGAGFAATNDIGSDASTLHGKQGLVFTCAIKCKILQN